MKKPVLLNVVAALVGLGMVIAYIGKVTAPVLSGIAFIALANILE